MAPAPNEAGLAVSLMVDSAATRAWLAEYKTRVKGMLEFAEVSAVEHSIRLLLPAIVRLTPRATGDLAGSTSTRTWTNTPGSSTGDSGEGVSFLQPQRNKRGERYWYFLASGYDLVYFGHPTGKHIPPKWHADEPYPREAYNSVFEQLRAEIVAGAAAAVKVMMPAGSRTV